MRLINEIFLCKISILKKHFTDHFSGPDSVIGRACVCPNNSLRKKNMTFDPDIGNANVLAWYFILTKSRSCL